MARMIGRLAALVQHLYEAIDMPRCTLNGREQILAGEVMRARTGHQ